MSSNSLKKTRIAWIFIIGLILCVLQAQAQTKKILTFKDIMQFRQINNPVISEDGRFIAYGTQPDRGDGDAVVHDSKGGKKIRVDRGSRPVISGNSLWAGLTVLPRGQSYGGRAVASILPSSS